MLKLWKVNAKAGDATVKYPFAPFPASKDMRGKPNGRYQHKNKKQQTKKQQRPLRGGLPHGGHQAH